MTKKILFILNTDKFLLSHRIEIANALIRHKYEVNLGSSKSEASKTIADLGIKTHKLEIDRTNLGILNLLKTTLSIYNLIKKINPDIVHFISIKPVILGCIATKFIRKDIKIITSVSGLGYIFIQDSLLGKIKKSITCCLYKFALSNKKIKVIFQNNSDKDLISRICNLSKKQTFLIKGSGVDLQKFKPIAKNINKKIVLMPSRVVKSKGIYEFVKAAEILKGKAKFIICGDLDREAKDYISLNNLNYWISNSIVEYIGFREDMNNLFNKASIIVLPSYREGLPRVICEAAACGKPVITTNVPGCKDAILPNKTGLLVPHKNIKELAKAINKLLENNSKVINMGLAGRKFAIENFDLNKVVEMHLKLYEN